MFTSKRLVCSAFISTDRGARGSVASVVTKYPRNSHRGDAGMFRLKGKVVCYILTDGRNFRRWYDAKHPNYARQVDGAGKAFHSRLLWFCDPREKNSTI